MSDPQESYYAIAANLAFSTSIMGHNIGLKNESCIKVVFQFLKTDVIQACIFHLSELRCCTRSEYSALQRTCYVLIMYGWTMIDINKQVQCTHTEVWTTTLRYHKRVYGFYAN